MSGATGQGRIRRALIADIGGTNARFAFVDAGGGIVTQHSFSTASFQSFADALHVVLNDLGRGTPVQAAAVAVAGPITGDRVRLTNHPWTFSRRKIAERFGFALLLVVNDLAAIARGVAELPAEAIIAIKPSTSGEADGLRAVIAPGTGLGVAALLPTESGWRVLPSEAGHVTMAAATDLEAEILARLRRDIGFVSAEDVLSARSLHALYRALAMVEGEAAPLTSAEEVGIAASAGKDALACRAVRLYAAMLGGFAGDVAVAFNAHGGVLLAGDLLPRLGPAFDRVAFAERFVAKGLFRGFLERIAVSEIVHPHPAFLGLLAMLRERNRGQGPGIAA